MSTNLTTEPTPLPTIAEIMERVITAGDLSKLTARESVDYYLKTCESLGLNPVTRPLEYLTFQGKKVLYARKDCSEQLRKRDGISLHIVDRTILEDLIIVHVKATMPDGRSDEDIGAVAIGQLKGEARANAIMKAITKAKRRATLSICGLGFLDETEVETLQGAVVSQPDIIVNRQVETTQKSQTFDVVFRDGTRKFPYKKSGVKELLAALWVEPEASFNCQDVLHSISTKLPDFSEEIEKIIEKAKDAELTQKMEALPDATRKEDDFPGDR